MDLMAVAALTRRTETWAVGDPYEVLYLTGPGVRANLTLSSALGVAGDGDWRESSRPDAPGVPWTRDKVRGVLRGPGGRPLLGGIVKRERSDVSYGGFVSKDQYNELSVAKSVLGAVVATYNGLRPTSMEKRWVLRLGRTCPHRRRLQIP